MATKNSRQLNNFELVEHFLKYALEYELNKSNYSIVPKIVTTELNIDNFDEKQITLQSRSYRNFYHRTDKERITLWNKIVADLITKKRLDSDEKIRLGRGGALPNTDIKQSKSAYIIIGLPASGKSTIANEIADEKGAIILDADYAKRKLPEFNSLPFGATLVHDESDAIIFSPPQDNKFSSLFHLATKFNLNVVVPKIGNNFESIVKLAKTFKHYEYKVHVTLVELDRKKATIRALDRFVTTDRYVPLSLIFDSYSNNPTISYYKLKSYYSAHFDSFGVLSTDVPKGQSPKCIESTSRSNPSNIFPR